MLKDNEYGYILLYEIPMGIGKTHRNVPNHFVGDLLVFHSAIHIGVQAQKSFVEVLTWLKGAVIKALLRWLFGSIGSIYESLERDVNKLPASK